MRPTPRRLLWIALSVGLGSWPLLGLAALPARAQAAAQLGSSSPSALTAPATVTYHSSVDNAALSYHEYLPSGYDAAVPYKCVILLPGVGGNLSNYDFVGSAWLTAADSHQYILITVGPRTLPGYPTSRATFYMNGALVPGEQDVLDALADVRARHQLDPSRLYLAGYSMGGVGALNLAALNPGVFAAAAPGAPMSDLFQQVDYAPTAPAPNFATLFGGPYSQTLAIKTYYYENSPRFLLPNLMHTPLRVVHGLSDTVIPNAAATWPYLQSRSIVDVPGFSDSRGQAITLQQLAGQWPGSFYEEHLWPAATHGTGSLYWLPDEILTFFDAHPLIANPATVAFVTYEDRHTRAYWLRLELTHPWTAAPGQVYATRNAAANSVQLQVGGSLTVTLDMTVMGLTSGLPLTVTEQPLGAGDAALTLTGAWPVAAAYTVLRDGAALPPEAYHVTVNSLSLLRHATDAPHTYVISTSASITPAVVLYLPGIVR